MKVKPLGVFLGLVGKQAPARTRMQAVAIAGGRRSEPCAVKDQAFTGTTLTVISALTL